RERYGDDPGTVLIMPLKPGYNIVTERVADTDTSMAALEFFRHVADNDPIETPVTVTGLEDLLYDAVEDEQGEILVLLRNALRKTDSLGSMDAVQFIIDGQIIDDVEFRIRIERSEGGVYLDIGQMFVEEPQRLTPTHGVARK
ncbi:MAG: hypothetical protein ABEI86_13995, partial [Halobacteriaceae archaeon]